MLGLSLSKDDGVGKFVKQVMVVVQSWCYALGIAIGVLVTNSPDFVEGLFMGISAGTFLYIALVEVIV